MEKSVFVRKNQNEVYKSIKVERSSKNEKKNWIFHIFISITSLLYLDKQKNDAMGIDIVDGNAVDFSDSKQKSGKKDFD